VQGARSSGTLERKATVNESAAKRLQQWRKARRLSQRQLAEWLAVSSSTVAYWEHGGLNPRREGLVRRALQCWDLMNGQSAEQLEHAIDRVVQSVEAMRAEVQRRKAVAVRVPRERRNGTTTTGAAGR
jgi:predicted transcriptional regulator